MKLRMTVEGGRMARYPHCRFCVFIDGPYNDVTGERYGFGNASTPATARLRALRSLRRRFVRDLRLPRPTIEQLKEMIR